MAHRTSKTEYSTSPAQPQTGELVRVLQTPRELQRIPDPRLDHTAEIVQPRLVKRLGGAKER